MVLGFPVLDKSIGDPISKVGFEFFTNFLHLFRQSALLKSHSVRSSVTGPPRQRLSASEFSQRIVHTSTNPISVSVELSLLLLAVRSLRHFETLSAPLRFSVVRRSHLSFRFPDPNLVFQVGGGSRGGGAGGGGNAEPLLLLLPGISLMPMALEAAPFALRRMSLALRLLHSRFPWRPEKNDRGLAPIARALQWSSKKLLPCGNGTVLNGPPLVCDLLLHLHIQGNCLCTQTPQGRFGATAPVAPVEL